MYKIEIRPAKYSRKQEAEDGMRWDGGGCLSYDHVRLLYRGVEAKRDSNYQDEGAEKAVGRSGDGPKVGGGGVESFSS